MKKQKHLEKISCNLFKLENTSNILGGGGFSPLADSSTVIPSTVFDGNTGKVTTEYQADMDYEGKLVSNVQD